MKSSKLILTAIAVGALMATAQAQTNLIIRDVFVDGIRTNTPIETTNSLWLTQDSGGGTLSGLVATPSPGMLVFSNVSASSRLIVAYFTPNSAEPAAQGNTNTVALAEGQQIRATVVYTPTNVPAVTANSTWGLRMGLFDFTSGNGGRTNRDGNVYNTTSATVAGTNILGYFFELNHVGTPNASVPFRIFARTNDLYLANNLLSTAGTNCYLLGEGPSIDTNAAPPGFVSGTTYTIQLTVARYATSNAITAQVTGGALNHSVTVVDTNTYAVPGLRKFDGFSIRSNRKEDVADFLTISEFKVETMPVPSGGTTSHPAFSLTSVSATGGSAILTWNSISGRSYEVLSTVNLATGPWVTNATVTATGATTSYTNGGVSGDIQRYFRILAPPQ